MTTYQKWLWAAVAAIWVVLAIHPPDREGWLLENLIVAVFVPCVLLAGRYLKLSSISYTLIAIFLVIHFFGAHWTYAKVPFGYTLGHWLGTDRNMYDRLAHFSFGLLFAYPIREAFIRLTGAKGVWGFYFPLDIVLSFSALYEIFEWLAAIIVDPVHAATFVGSQGDFWDTPKDMASAFVGSVVAMTIVFAVNWIYNRKLRTEIAESIRIKDAGPMGEDAFAAMLRREFSER